MRFSVWVAPGRPWEELLEVATHAAGTGGDGIWFAITSCPTLAEVAASFR